MRKESKKRINHANGATLGMFLPFLLLRPCKNDRSSELVAIRCCWRVFLDCECWWKILVRP